MDEKEALKELSKRIDEVSGNNDIPRMSNKDMIIAAVFAAVCLAGVILGGIFL
ncbi:MAG: hypothetical protein J5685_11470 [Clostridiales bacterium]|nr:hypothetical protein [Clostridiales bacterium]